MGRGKNGKRRDEAAMRVHDEWAGRFKRLRNGQAEPLRPQQRGNGN